MNDLLQCITLDACKEAITNSGLVIDTTDIASFEISMPNVEQLLFATLIESHYLGYCLSLCEPDLDSKALLTMLVRAFHHYFQGESIQIPMNIGVFSTRKPE